MQVVLEHHRPILYRRERWRVQPGGRRLLHVQQGTVGRPKDHEGPCGGRADTRGRPRADKEEAPTPFLPARGTNDLGRGHLQHLDDLVRAGMHQCNLLTAHAEHQQDEMELHVLWLERDHSETQQPGSGRSYMRVDDKSVWTGSEKVAGLLDAEHKEQSPDMRRKQAR